MPAMAKRAFTVRMRSSLEPTSAHSLPHGGAADRDKQGLLRPKVGRTATSESVVYRTYDTDNQSHGKKRVRYSGVF